MIPGLILLKYVRRKPIPESDKVEGETASWKYVVSLCVLLIASMVIFYKVQG